MTGLSIGDLAQSFTLRHHTARVKAELIRLGTEVTTGQSADLSRRVKGDFTALAGVERALHLLKSHETPLAEAGLFTAGMQTVLGTAQDQGTALAQSLLVAAGTEHPGLLHAAATDARARFETVVAALNTRVGDRAVLAGTAVGASALAPAADMLARLARHVAGQTTAADVAGAVEAWFQGPEFLALAYRGTGDEALSFPLGPHETLRIEITAAAPGIRQVLAGFAMAALVAEGVLEGAPAQQAALLQRAGEGLLSANDALGRLRADLGGAQARIAGALTRNAAEAAALRLARAEIIGVDPYDAAVALKEAETRLETLYTLTARLSNLKLTDYL